MSKNILVISTSPRKNGNSALLAEEFARGAADAGHQVENRYDERVGQYPLMSAYRSTHQSMCL